jgi:hypothetical protein
MRGAGHGPGQLRSFLGTSLQPKQDGDRAHGRKERVFSGPHMGGPYPIARRDSTLLT